MREIMWAVVGWLFGIGASRRARNVIAEAHASGQAYFYGTLNTSAVFVPAVAFVNAAVAYGIAHRLERNMAAFAFVVFATNMLQQMFVDIDTHLLPRGRSRGATFFGMILLGLASLAPWSPARWWWGILGSFLMWLVMRVMQAVSRGDLGGGDVSIAVVMGLHLGWLAIGNVFIALLVSFLMAGLFGLAVLVVRRNRRQFIAFGPWLVAGSLLTVVFEPQLRAWIGG